MTNNIATNSRSRTLLWTALVVSLVCNAGASLAGLAPYVGVVFGIAATLCVIGLVVQHRRR